MTFLDARGGDAESIVVPAGASVLFEVQRLKAYAIDDLDQRITRPRLSTRRSDRSPTLPVREPGRVGMTSANGHVPADILLVGCVKSKRSKPAPAKDLYVSPLFSHERRFAEASGSPWFILSAEYGLVAPDEWVSPYERYLPDTPAGYRSVWGAWVAERLEMLVGPLAHTVVEIHAGSTYADALTTPLQNKRATLRLPLAGLGMGRRLQWYAARNGSTGAKPVSAAPESPSADAVVADLLDGDSAVSPGAFLASDRRALAVPGLYSWWVDAAGALDLARGLGEPIRPGLIYAGLAGATRWPSGRRSTNTLWSRVAGMHLGGRNEFSTFRRSLGAILAEADGRRGIDEENLTSWMSEHLAVRTVASPDPDALGHLERAVLERLDPPLNLMGMQANPTRARLRELRRLHAGTM